MSHEEDHEEDAGRRQHKLKKIVDSMQNIDEGTKKAVLDQSREVEEKRLQRRNNMADFEKMEAAAAKRASQRKGNQKSEIRTKVLKLECTMAPTRRRALQRERRMHSNENNTEGQLPNPDD